MIRRIFVICATTVFACSAPAWAEDQFLPIGDGWQTYVNDRFGISVDYPAEVFEAQPEPENLDGRSFSADNAELHIFGLQNVEQDTPSSLKRRLVGTEGYEKVTYSPSGGRWLVLSGYRDSRIFYEKYFFSGEVISALGVEFPEEEKPYYAPLIERMEDSFRAGGP
jgi:hypothetical protein